MSRPTHDLVLKRRHKREYSQVGVAWANDDESMSIVLNAGVVLDWRMTETHTLAAYPNKEEQVRMDPEEKIPF